MQRTLYARRTLITLSGIVVLVMASTAHAQASASEAQAPTPSDVSAATAAVDDTPAAAPTADEQNEVAPDDASPTATGIAETPSPQTTDNAPTDAAPEHSASDSTADAPSPAVASSRENTDAQEAAENADQANSDTPDEAPQTHEALAEDASEDAAEDEKKLSKARQLLYNRQAFEGRPTRVANSDELYDRPFVVGGQRAAVGGYLEAGGTWTKEEGDILGTNFFLKRFNLFVYARVLPRVEFIAELEWEDGGNVIAIETAQLDVELASWLTMRAGVILVPLGAFNQTHDAPRWPIVDRPLVSETIIPATHSEVGIGFVAEESIGDFRLNGQLYVTNGLGSGVIGNETGRVDISSGKHDGILNMDNNGRPAVSGRLALLHKDHLEFGVSAYHTAYNEWFLEGETYDRRRHVTIAALDLRAEFWRFELRGEAAMAWVDVPDYMHGIYSPRQFGWHLDLYTDLWRHTLGTGTEARLRWIMRGEQADYYQGALPDGRKAGDQISGLTVGLAWELNRQIVFRGSVRNRWTRDILNNPAEREVQVQLGVASYF